MNRPDRYTFRCPVCQKFFTYEHKEEPVCTGPSEMRHDHEHTIMRLHSVARREINPLIGEARANGPLILNR